MDDGNSSTWVAAFDAMKSNYQLTNDSIGVFALNLQFGLDDIQTIAGEAITGGGDDKKCDVLYVDKERQIAVIAQCYIAEKRKASAPANKASDLNTALTWALSTDLDRLPDGLKGRADELRAALNDGEIKQFYIWYVHNLPDSENVQEELRSVEVTARNALKRFERSADINIFAEEIGDAQLERIFTQAERTVAVTEEFETFVSDAIEIEEGEWSSLVTTVSGTWLHELYREHQTSLFSANLRGYLGSRQSDSNINNGIKATASEEPSNFYVFNNGITALVLDYKIAPRRRGRDRKLTITGLSIVNGAQTTGSIGSLREVPFNLRVPIRFVKANRDALVASIVRFNNSQNKLQAADFRSTDQIQERLRSQFMLVPEAEYEGGRRGGASDAIKRSKFTLPSYTVGQSLAAFHGDPVTAYDKKSELWTNEKNYRQIFTDRTTARHVVFCYSLLSSLNERKLELASKRRVTPGEMRSSESEHLDFLNKKGASYLLVHVISQCMEVFLDRPIVNKFDLRFIENVSPSSAAENWAPIVEVMLALSGQLSDGFSRGRISNESVANAVPKFVGVIRSLQSIHRPTFDSFAAGVEISSNGSH